jgi:GntR family transcriptional regulator
MAGSAGVHFAVDRRSGVPTYLQLVHQVEQALRLGWIAVGEQLPTAREVVADLAINPNTVHKAYRELERAGLVEVRPGQGTFVCRGVAGTGLDEHPELVRQLEDWADAVIAAGLGEPDLRALFDAVLRARLAALAVPR